MASFDYSQPLVLGGEAGLTVRPPATSKPSSDGDQLRRLRALRLKLKTLDDAYRARIEQSVQSEEEAAQSLLGFCYKVRPIEKAIKAMLVDAPTDCGAQPGPPAGLREHEEVSEVRWVKECKSLLIRCNLILTPNRKKAAILVYRPILQRVRDMRQERGRCVTFTEIKADPRVRELWTGVNSLGHPRLKSMKTLRAVLSAHHLLGPVGRPRKLLKEK